MIDHVTDKVKNFFNHHHGRYIFYGILILLFIVILILIIVLAVNSTNDNTNSSSLTSRLIFSNHTCNSDNDCNENQVCFSGSCKLNNNEICKNNKDCASNSCIEGICIHENLGNYNQKCYTSSEGRLKCKDGLICNPNGICKGDKGFYDNCDNQSYYCSTGLSCLNIDLGTPCKGNNSCICDFSYSHNKFNEVSCILGLEENKEEDECLNTSNLPCNNNEICVSGVCNKNSLGISKLSFGSRFIGSSNFSVNSIPLSGNLDIGNIKKAILIEDLNLQESLLLLTSKGLFQVKLLENPEIKQIFKGTSIKVDGEKYILYDIASNGFFTYFLLRNSEGTSKIFSIETSKHSEELIPYDLIPYNSLSGIQYYNNINKEVDEIKIKSIDVNDNGILLITGIDDYIYTPIVSNNYVYERVSEDATIEGDDLVSFMYLKTDDKVTSSSAKFYDNINNNNFSYINDMKIIMKGDFEFSSPLTRYLSVYSPLSFSNFYIKENSERKKSNISISIVGEGKDHKKSLFITNADPEFSQQMKFGNPNIIIEDDTIIVAGRDSFYIISKGSCM